MKRTVSFHVILIMLLMLAGVSSGAETGPYLSLNLGASFPNDTDVNVSAGSRDSVIVDYKPGTSGTFTAGYNFGTVRVEGEFGYQENNVDYIYREYEDVNYYYDINYGAVNYNESNMTAWSFLGNFYLDWVNSTPVTPFISIGIGMAYVELFDLKDSAPAYQLGAGLAFEITPHVSIDLKYRYFVTDDLDFEGYNIKYASQNVYGGLRYTF